MMMLECKRKKSSKKEKRRFSDEQIRYLDQVFESESKLDPRKKVEVARKLDLQPRQVAIWFQNKRARWKSRHIEKEYSLLLSNYNNLSAQFETLKTEKQSLQNQLEDLKKEMRVKENEEWAVVEGGVTNGGGSDGESESNKIDFEQVKNDDGVVVSDDDSNMINININTELLPLPLPLPLQLQLQSRDEDELLGMSDWGSLDSDDIIINQSSSQWWGFWS